MLAANLKAIVEVKGVPQAAGKLRDFQAKLKEVSTSSATADLEANLKAAGFEEFTAKIDEAKAKSARPITQTVKVDYKSAPAQAAMRDLEKLKTVWGGEDGNGGLGKGLGEALTPFGKKWTAITALSPVLLGVAGGLAAIAGSAAEAAAGVGALGISAGGVASVGLAGIAAIAVPAVKGLKELTTAQQAYTAAVALYGPNSKEAATALGKLHLAEREAGPAATALAKGLDDVSDRWKDLTKSGQNNFLGIGKDAIERVQKLLPSLASSANSSVAALREGFDNFLSQVTGPGFNHFIEVMTGTFATVVPRIGHGLADWAQILMRIAEAAAPSLEKVVHLWSDWSDRLLKSTGDSKSLEGTIEKLVGQTMAWVHLLGAAGNLLIAVFSSGASEGGRLVEDLTGKFEQWSEWIEGHKGQVQEFFHRSAETLRKLSIILAGFVEQWYVFAEALYPIARAFLSITQALNSIKVGNVSALTALLTAYVAARGIGKIGGAIKDASTLGGLRTGASTAGEGAAGAGFGATITGAAPIVAAAAVGTAVVELASHRAGSAAEKASQRLKQLDEEGKGVLGSLGRLGEGLPKSIAGSVVGWAESGDKAHRLLQIMELMHLSGEKRSRQLLDEGRSLLNNLDLTRRQKTEYEKVLTSAQEANVQVAFHRGVSTLASGEVTRLQDIKKAAAQNAEEAALGWKVGGKGWKKATAENMLAVVSAIKAGEQQGVIAADKGNAEIAQVMREYHLLTGNDPFHIAAAFASSWREAEHVSEAGINHALAELGKMPPASQAIAEQTMLHQVRAYERGGELAKGTFSRLRSAIVTELQRTREHGGAQVERFTEDFEGAFGELGASVASVLEGISGNTSQVLKALGATALPHFHRVHGYDKGATNADQAAFKAFGKGHQRGGHIDIGAPSGDSVPAMLERGEYVLNRNAVQAIGTNHLDAINYGAHSRFQTGGHVGGLGAEPHLAGPAGGMRTLGQSAIHEAYKAAQQYLGKHQPSSSSLAGLNVPTGPIQQMAREMILRTWDASQWAPFVQVVMQESGWDPHAQNPTSTAYGIAQNLNPSTYPAAGRPGSHAPILSQAKAQLAWMVNYIRERYGNPAGAWAHETSAGWYQKGGRVGFQAGGAASDYLKHKWEKAKLLAGFIPQAETELGVPHSHHKAHEHATASDAVHWAMRHLGSGDQWGYPGEWCGAFVAADMKALGLPVPSGYPAAASWASYGTPLGRNHIQGGAILDYGSAHVALAISGTQQIQGNDIHGQVGTSGIGGTIGGSPLTDVRWPPYGTGPSAGSKIAETVPKRSPYNFKGGATSAGGGTFAPGSGHVNTAKLSFGALPGDLHHCRKELTQRRDELARYRSALGKTKMPGERHAIQVNINLLTHRIQALLRLQTRLIAKAAREKVVGRIKGRGTFPHLEAAIHGRELAYDKAQEYAEQIVALEPVENAASYIQGPESQAYGAVLSTEADWRNSILAGEGVVGQRIAALRHQVKSIEALKHRHRRAYNKQKYRLPALEGAIKAAQGVFDPATHSGTFEEDLQNVQGFFGGREPLASLPSTPVAGVFGGLIFQTQTAIRELGLKLKEGISTATPGTESNSERVGLLETLLRNTHERELVKQIGARTLAGFPYAGAYAAGGIVRALVGEQGPELATLPAGTRITPANETRQMLTPTLTIQELHVHHDGSVSMKYGNKEFELEVGKVVRETTGVGRPMPGGAVI